MQILKHVLGKMLYFRETNEPMNEFPSPESLKLRIMVSTKPPKEYLEAEIEPTLSVREELEEADKQEKVESPVKDRADDTWGEEVSEFPIPRCHPDDEVGTFQCWTGNHVFFHILRVCIKWILHLFFDASRVWVFGIIWVFIPSKT